jgi:mono/diheme cytochrome c family protein
MAFSDSLPVARYAALLLCAALAGPARAEAPPVEFNRDVRPILADACFQCHGPDRARRKAGLRLDTEEGATADLGEGTRAVFPGRPEQSELLRRVTSTDDTQRMPPPRSGRALTPAQVEVLRRWVEQGAKWQKHWAFLTPRRLPLPAVNDRGWVRNPIDSFVLARLEREGLRPSSEADRATLIRRVSLDLTGLPPTPAEVGAFLADASPDAYERVVDRLLASPRYGERMAVRWLDAARYADTNGYQSDGERTMWRWRDWVIDAFNANLPFDRFTVEQIAGDLLPGATLGQRIATGFNRNHRGNAEGGIIPEEYAVEYVVDRVETTATVFLGLTLGCARCHDHKYDPFAQREFYRAFAYFNNVPERGKAVKYGNSPPVVQAPTREQREWLARLDAELARAEREWAGLGARLDAAQREWEKKRAAAAPADWNVEDRLLLRLPLDENAPDGRFRDGPPAYSPGRLGQAADFDGRRYLEAGDLADFGYLDKFSIALWAYPRGPGGTLVSRMADTARAEGYSVGLEGGRVQVNLVKRWLDDALRVETERALAPGRWYHVLVTYDGSRVADGIKVYIDGRPERLKVHLDDLNQDFRTKEPLRVGGGGGPAGRFHGLIDEVRVYRDRLSPEEAEVVACADAVADLTARPPAQRTAQQARKLRAYFLARAAPAPLRQAWGRVVELRRQRERLVESFPTSMVMQEMPVPRETHLLLRGQYDKPGPKVTPGVPASLTPLPAGAPNNRLGLARWLVDPANPLTARVAANRYWETFFGTGLVKTAEDFGTQGEWPSHPELLDWLATEFVRTGWDVKAMQHLIVTSATYRQSSRATPELLRRDPENRLLARGPRFRLPAETIRDQALAVSGLLAERVGGPSVKPYQPAGLWRELADTEYVRARGPDLYRRSLYTFWKRTVAPPAMVTFDAAGREACTVRRARTNTPLQALTLMNDVTYVEAARVLAQRVMREGGPTAAGRLALAFQLATARRPRPAELRVLVGNFEDHLARYRGDRDAARKLLTAGEAPRDERLDPCELAAYTATASLVLNLDEVVTKE